MELEALCRLLQGDRPGVPVHCLRVVADNPCRPVCGMFRRHDLHAVFLGLRSPRGYSGRVVRRLYAGGGVPERLYGLCRPEEHSRRAFRQTSQCREVQLHLCRLYGHRVRTRLPVRQLPQGHGVHPDFPGMFGLAGRIALYAGRRDEGASLRALQIPRCLRKGSLVQHQRDFQGVHRAGRL